jgi:hypothetical protein
MDGSAGPKGDIAMESLMVTFLGAFLGAAAAVLTLAWIHRGKV